LLLALLFFCGSFSVFFDGKSASARRDDRSIYLDRKLLGICVWEDSLRRRGDSRQAGSQPAVVTASSSTGWKPVGRDRQDACPPWTAQFGWKNRLNLLLHGPWRMNAMR
jgi:hypothetical protein